jgi:hypothetical protein
MFYGYRSKILNSSGRCRTLYFNCYLGRILLLSNWICPKARAQVLNCWPKYALILRLELLQFRLVQIENIFSFLNNISDDVGRCSSIQWEKSRDRLFEITFFSNACSQLHPLRLIACISKESSRKKSIARLFPLNGGTTSDVVRNII